MNLKRLGRIGFLVVLILFQAGFVSPSDGATAPNQNTTSLSSDVEIQYRVDLTEGDPLVFDAEGNEISEEKQMTVLYDRITGQPQCQMRKVLTDSGKDTEYGTPIATVKTYLYDMDETLIYEVVDKEFAEGFGDFLILQDPKGNVVSADDLPLDYQSVLWNYKTKETVLDGVFNIQVMNEDNSRFLMTNYLGYLLGVTDKDAKVISGFPPPKGYYGSTPWNGMIISSNLPAYLDGEHEENKDTLLTEQLETVFSASSINSVYYGLLNDSLMVIQEDTKYLLDKDLKLCCSLPESVHINYFDGELFIRGFLPKDKTEETTTYLDNINGTKVSAGYDWIVPMQSFQDNGAAQKFLAGKGDRLEILNREGQTIAQNEIPELEGAHFFSENKITCYIKNNSTALLNEKLEVLIEPGKYMWIDQIGEWQGGKRIDYDLLMCSYFVSGEEILRRDILDFSLNPIIKGVTSIGTVGPDRIAVVRGFSAGLIDWKGNWIVKKSIFNKLNDDYNEWGIY